MDLFMKATRWKTRFQSPRHGQVSTEDLWDLPMKDLEAIAQGINKKVEAGGKTSFFSEESPSADHKEAVFMLEIVKAVGAQRLADKERAEKAAETRAKKERLLSLIEKKQDEELEGKSLEELQALVDGI
jgi:hypothetical protein